MPPSTSIYKFNADIHCLVYHWLIPGADKDSTTNIASEVLIITSQQIKIFQLSDLMGEADA
jgi:hypothetical protein